MTKSTHAARIAPRLDPYGVLDMLEPMTNRQIGTFAYPFVRAALEGRPDVTCRHILDLCGWALAQREYFD